MTASTYRERKAVEILKAGLDKRVALCNQALDQHRRERFLGLLDGILVHDLETMKAALAALLADAPEGGVQ